MRKYLSYAIFGDCLPGEKVITLLFTKRAEKFQFQIKVSKTLVIYTKFYSKGYYSEENVSLTITCYYYYIYILYHLQEQTQIRIVGCCNSLEKIKLKWTDETSETTTELMHVTFYNNQWFLVEAGTISLNYSRLSICQILLISFLKPCLNYVFQIPL